MDNFDAVWERVSGATYAIEPETVKQGDREALRAFMDDEYAACSLYTALAARCPAFSKTLYSIAADERCHFKKHQLEYFLLYGDKYYPAPASPAVCGTLAALREALTDENAASAAYLKAANETGVKSLSDNYLSIAETEQRHAITLRRIIEKSL